MPKSKRSRPKAPAEHYSTMVSIHSLSVELLESILLRLSMEDLFRVQRVSKKWQGVISSSPQLLRQMFLGFVPASVPTERLPRFVIHNYESGKRDSSSPGHGCSDIFSLDDAADLGPVRFNPVFPSEGNVLRTRTKQFRTSLDSRSSWLNMYLTQPPCDFAEVSVYYKRPSSKSLIDWLEKRSDIAVGQVLVRRCRGVRVRDILEDVGKSPFGRTKSWQRIDIEVPGIVNLRAEGGVYEDHFRREAMRVHTRI